jgi:hypothetical protein
MGNVILIDWRRGIRHWRFWATTAATLGLFVLSMIQDQAPWILKVIYIPNADNFFTGALAFLGAYVYAFWPIFIPALAALPAGDTVAVDRRRGADALSITRVGWSRYLWGRLIGNALIALTAVALAIAIAMVLSAVLYPDTLPKFLGWHFEHPPQIPRARYISGVFGDAYWPTFQPHFFWALPGPYLVGASLVALWATMALSGLSIAASVWLRPPVLVLAVPVVLYFAASILGSGRTDLLPWVYAGSYLSAPSVIAPHLWEDLAAYWAVPAAVAAGVLGWIAGRRREWPEGSVGQ